MPVWTARSGFCRRRSRKCHKSRSDPIVTPRLLREPLFVCDV